MKRQESREDRMNRAKMDLLKAQKAALSFTIWQSLDLVLFSPQPNDETGEWT